MINSQTPILSIDELNVDMTTETGVFQVLRNVAFELYPGETLGVVGESGSGKTVTCLSLLKLLATPPAIYRSGVVEFKGTNLWKIPESELKRIRGREISIVFQEALSALNPVIKVGEQISEVLTYHFELQRDAGMSIIFISHDLGVIAEVCHRVVVMYADSTIEVGTVEQIFFQSTTSLHQTITPNKPKFGKEQRRICAHIRASPITTISTKRMRVSSPMSGSFSKIF